MRMITLIMVMLAAVVATEASAQSVNITGTYKCVQGCRADGPAFVTQNGFDLNLVNEAGEPSRAWFDWAAPLTRIWIEAWNEGAVYSPDGMVIQFDNGSVWQRDLGLPPARRRK